MLGPRPYTKGSLAKRMQIVQPPSAEPIGAVLAKVGLKLNVNESAFALARRIAAARNITEQAIRRKLVLQIWDMYLDDEVFVGSQSSLLPTWAQYYSHSETNHLSEIQLPFPQCVRCSVSSSLTILGRRRQ